MGFLLFRRRVARLDLVLLGRQVTLSEVTETTILMVEGRLEGLLRHLQGPMVHLQGRQVHLQGPQACLLLL